MRAWGIIWGLLVALSVWAAPAVAAEPAESANSTNSLTVGVAGSAPFVTHSATEAPASIKSAPTTPGSLDGISLRLWERIAGQQGFEYSLKSYGEDVAGALDALKRGEVDVVVGPISITALRAQDIRFSQPYYQAGVSILSKASDHGIWTRLKPLFSLQLLIGIGVLLCILAVVGTLIWLAERKASPEQFPPDPLRGIANGMWCAIVTMSTTGYGDLAPTTLKGRVIAGAWMIISLLFATTMVAGIASTLTLNGIKDQRISKAEQLQNRRVAVASSSPAARFVSGFGAQITPIKTLEQGYSLLKNGKVDAVVFDRPQMLYFLRIHPDDDVAVSTSEYIRQGYGFAVMPASREIHGVNVEILKVKESGDLQPIIEPWLGDFKH